MQIKRTSPYEFEAITYAEDGSNLQDVRDYISNQYINSNHSVDENDNIRVIIGPPDQDGLLHPGDTITRIFTEYWTIIAAADFANGWATV